MRIKSYSLVLMLLCTALAGMGFAKSSSTVRLNSSLNPSTYGNSVTFTASVTCEETATGTVTFMDGTTVLGTSTIVDTTAAFATDTDSNLTAGSHSITAVYNGNANCNGSTSPTLTQTVNKAPLTVTAQNASRAYGAANPTFSDIITGFVNGDTQSVVSGTASLTTTATASSAPGTYPITAGLGTLSAANYTFSTFVNGTLTITQATPTITWATPPAITYGTALSATQLDATASVAGNFVYSPAAGTVLAEGTQTLSVTFTPTNTTDYTTATGSVQLTVNQATPTITWTTPAAITYGTALSSTQLDATASVAGTFVYSPAAGTVLAAGTQTLSVTFTPTNTTDYTTATGLVQLVVNSATTTVTLTSSPNPSAYGALVIFTATVSPSTATGTITFTDGSTPLGTVTISNGTATYSTSALAAGSHSITAYYSGDADDDPSMSSVLTQMVNGTYTNGYQYRQTIVLSHANVPNTDQTDFPALISGVYSYLATISNGGLVQGANGYDIIFSQDPEGAIKLDHEIDNYNPVTGTASFWVRIPTLSHTVDTVIYLFYGNPSITTSQENVTGVWRNNYLSVYHLGNGTTVGLTDSGSAGYTLAGSASAVSGKIGGGAAFNGNPGTYLYYDSVGAYPSGDSPVTLETWVQLASSTGGEEIVGYGANSGNGSRDGLWWDGSNAIMEFENLGVSGPMPFDSNWHHLVGVYGGGALSTTNDQLYLDGAPLSTTTSGGTPAITTTELKIGGIPTVTSCCALTGSVDEVRVSSGVRSGDWVATEYANESSPSTFYTVEEGQATPNSAPTIQLLSPNAYPLGVPIVIQGYGFQPNQGGSTVTFNGVTATPTSWNDASIVVLVPAGATTGNVVVTVGGVASNGMLFTVIAGPTIASMSPTAGPVGASTTITGTNFGATQGTSTVAFNGTTATTITSWSATSIVATVPTGATTGNVVVTVSGVPSPGVSFTVLPIPAVNSLSPAAGPVGTQVTIQGTNFGSSQGSSTVSFNGSSAASIVSWSNSQIVAVAPSTVTTGPVVVVVNSVPSNTNVVFTAYNPVITSLSPPSGASYSFVIVNGYGFGASQISGSGVMFNGSPCNVKSWSDSAVEVQVSGFATSGPVTVTMNGVTSNGVEFTIEAPPAITTVSPTSGGVGTTVTINGSGFGPTESNSAVLFNGAAATANNWSDTEIVVAVPSNATTGPVTVTVAGITAQGSNFTFDSIGNLTASNGSQTTYTSTMIGGVWRVTSVQGPGCSSCSIRGNMQYTYDGNGNVLTSTDANGNTITYTYDGNNNVLSKSAQLNGTAVTTSYTYNSFGEVLTMTDPLGNTTTNTYDAHGNLLTVSSPAPNGQTPPSVTQFAYNNLGELTQITDPLNHPTTLSYYSTGLIQSITDAQNNTTSYAYDGRGNRTGVIDPINGSAHPTTFTYDILNRLTGITYPDGTSGSFAYDYRGRRISATDQNGKTTSYTYDDADRLLTVTDPAGHLTQYNYDTENNLLSITDANNHTTYFTYDALGRVTQTTFPSTLTETYTYDQVYNLTSKTDRKGQTIQYVYDSLYRMISKTYSDQTSANYVYDLAGKLQQVSDPTGTYGFAYDNMGRVIGTTTQYPFLPGHNFQNTYTYDAASNRTSLTAPDGSTNSYNYDTLNRLMTLTSSLTGQFGFGYDTLSRRTQLTRPNGVNTNYNYDGLSRLLSVLHQTGSTTLDGASYGYDYTGNRTSKTNYLNGITSNYGYDAIYELQQVTQGGSTTESYSYDAVGNRLSSLGINQYSYNTSNELLSTSNGSYTYDANGNTLSDPSGKQYTWDFENRLVSAVIPGTGTVTFKYDPFGRRVYKSSPNFTGIFAYDGYNLIETMNSSGALLARYTQTQNIDEPLADLRSGSDSYYEVDGLGSVTSLSNSAGSVANTYTYDSFGMLTTSSGTLTNPFRYTAREFDPETGIYEYRARYYDQSVGRFISEDPIGLTAGMNKYEYVNNSASNAVDPLGLATCVYSISAGTLSCTPDDPNHQPVIIPVASGNNGINTTASHCKNNAKCTKIPNIGPIPLGWWTWTNQSTAKPNGRVLVPQPGTDVFDREPNTFRSHSCANPFGPSLTPPYCSGGCITGTAGDIQTLNGLIDSEPGSTVEVVP